MQVAHVKHLLDLSHALGSVHAGTELRNEQWHSILGRVFRSLVEAFGVPGAASALQVSRGLARLNTDSGTELAAIGVIVEDMHAGRHLTARVGLEAEGTDFAD